MVKIINQELLDYLLPKLSAIATLLTGQCGRPLLSQPLYALYVKVTEVGGPRAGCGTSIRESELPACNSVLSLLEIKYLKYISVQFAYCISFSLPQNKIW